MTLSNLTRKGGLTQVATATSATLATLAAASKTTVAQVATVAVAEPQPLATAMTTEEETAVRAWLTYIEETDSEIITLVLRRCQSDVEVRAYILRHAEEVTRPMPDNDDRRHCAQCANLAPSGLCLAAWRGEIIASRTYRPIDYLPRRCEGYLPRSDDRNQRPRCKR